MRHPAYVYGLVAGGYGVMASRHALSYPRYGFRLLCECTFLQLISGLQRLNEAVGFLAAKYVSVPALHEFRSGYGTGQTSRKSPNIQ